MPGLKTAVYDAIGNTPLVELGKVTLKNSARIVAKLEWANPTGSMKDRMAKTVIAEAYKRGDIKKGSTVVEYTAGTTGISLAFVCAALGYHFHAIFSDAFSHEKRIAMKAFGAQVTDVISDNKKITEKLIKEMIETSRKISNQEDHWWADQLNNRDAEEGYYALGDEIWQQTDGQVDAFVHTVSTAHSIHGVTKALRRHNSGIKVFAVEPDESAVLSGRASGSHQIEGIGIGFVPPLWQPNLVDEILTVTTSEAMAMAKRLAREEGIFAGTSSGANLIASMKIAERMGPGKTIATIIVDSGFRYISTPLYQPIG
ncbi:MAG: cysteine synthase family protein [Bacteroidota bacterium]|nr:cysteine synthase family protein [Bacteroidota bacterium]